MNTAPTKAAGSIDALPPWTPRPFLAMREWAALWRVVLSAPSPREQPPAGVPVLLVPGFMAGDWSLRPMARHLRRLGFRTFPSGIRANVGCTTEMIELLERRLVDIASVTGPVAIVGHSRGGTLARLVAARHPELVSQVITLGSPLSHQFGASTHVLRIAEALARRDSPNLLDDDCLRGDCASRVEAALAEPLPAAVPLTSVVSLGDGVVYWRYSLQRGAGHIRISGSHNGLASNPRAIAAVARTLASPPTESQHPTALPEEPARQETTTFKVEPTRRISATAADARVRPTGGPGSLPTVHG